MTREIKFRAWDKYGNAMRLVKSIKYADDGFAKTIMVHLVGGITFCYVHGESCELMQYTGLTDRNGKEIYEGDILKDDEGIAKVDFEMGQFIALYQSLSGKWNSYGTLSKYMADHDGDIIGNIYENADLLPQAPETTAPTSEAEADKEGLN